MYANVVAMEEAVRLATGPRALNVNGLTAYRDERFEEWATTFVRATSASVQRAEELGGEIEGLQAAWHEQAKHPRAGSAAAKLTSMLPVHPVVNVRTTMETLGVAEEAARRAIDLLSKAGAVEEVTGRLRSRWPDSP